MFYKQGRVVAAQTSGPGSGAEVLSAFDLTHRLLRKDCLTPVYHFAIQKAALSSTPKRLRFEM